MVAKKCSPGDAAQPGYIYSDRNGTEISVKQSFYLLVADGGLLLERFQELIY